METWLNKGSTREQIEERLDTLFLSLSAETRDRLARLDKWFELWDAIVRLLHARLNQEQVLHIWKYFHTLIQQNTIDYTTFPWNINAIILRHNIPSILSDSSLIWENNTEFVRKQIQRNSRHSIFSSTANNANWISRNALKAWVFIIILFLYSNKVINRNSVNRYTENINKYPSISHYILLELIALYHWVNAQYTQISKNQEQLLKEQTQRRSRKPEISRWVDHYLILLDKLTQIIQTPKQEIIDFLSNPLNIASTRVQEWDRGKIRLHWDEILIKGITYWETGIAYGNGISDALKEAIEREHPK